MPNSKERKKSNPMSEIEDITKRYLSWGYEELAKEIEQYVIKARIRENEIYTTRGHWSPVKFAEERIAELKKGLTNEGEL